MKTEFGWTRRHLPQGSMDVQGRLTSGLAASDGDPKLRAVKTQSFISCLFPPLTFTLNMYVISSIAYRISRQGCV